MFVDEVLISATAGKGGDGCVHFRKEKYIPKGGPDGGDGGRGGNIHIQAVHNLHTLYDYRHQKVFQAPNGRPGDKNNRHGKNGEDLHLKVPVGSIIKNKKTGEILADFTKDQQMITVAQGGQGGKGNAGFVNSIRQAPNFAEKGDQGEHVELQIELKLVADVAIVGFPSAGKSTLISVISNAKPKIAEYHFTTLVPNLGVVEINDRELVFVDVPGLIEGAHEGKGLGHRFLKHIERARFVIFLIDVTSNTPLNDFEILKAELEKFSQNLAHKPFIPVFSKIDLTDTELEDFLMSEFEQKFNTKPMKISAATHEGVKDLLHYITKQIPENEAVLEKDHENELYDMVDSEDPETEDVVEFHPAETKKDGRQVIIEKHGPFWELQNDRLEQMVRQTDYTNPEARERIYDVLKKWNIPKKLERRGALAGDQIRIGELLWDFRG